MKLTKFRLNIKSIDQQFQRVDRSIKDALGREILREAREAYDAPSQPESFAGKVAANPELADVYLSVDTRIGKDEILIKPIEGLPTGLTEVFEHPNYKESLLKVYDHTLALIKDKFPETSVYRTSVTNLTLARKEIVEKSRTREEIESSVGSGLVEEILIQAAEEFRLAEIMAENRVWSEREQTN